MFTEWKGQAAFAHLLVIWGAVACGHPEEGQRGQGRSGSAFAEDARVMSLSPDSGGDDTQTPDGSSGAGRPGGPGEASPGGPTAGDLWPGAQKSHCRAKGPSVVGVTCL